MVGLRENKTLKWLLIIQSFTPLFVLLLIKYFKWDIFALIFKFTHMLMREGIIKAVEKAWFHDEFLRVVLWVFCVALLLLGIWIYYYFRGTQNAGFTDRAEKISVGDDTTEMSMAFFATYVIPMVMDDVTELRGFLCFIIVIVMLVLLMRNTNLYYQNPVLTVLGYKTFQFLFVDTAEKDFIGNTYIAITRGEFNQTKIIKRKYISDNVFLIYNKN